MRTFLRFLGIGAALSLVGGAALALVTIDINLTTQRMHVSDSAGEDYDWAISSGRPGHRTPQGTFHPIAMYEMVHSAKYNNAPMSHSIFFLGAYAIHGTNAVGHLGRTASHGCIRLAPGNASTLFQMVEEERAVIRIHGEPQDAGLRMASRHHRRSVPALAYAPSRPAKSLREWTLSPDDGR